MSAAAAAAKSLQSCLTLCDPIDGSLLGSPVPGILQARTLEWVAIISTAKDMGSASGQGTKIPQASWCGQKLKRKKIMLQKFYKPSSKDNIKQGYIDRIYDREVIKKYMRQ